MKPRKLRVEFIIETDRPSNEVKKDVKACFHRQFGIVSYVKIIPSDVSQELILTFSDLIPYLGKLRTMLKQLQQHVKDQKRWDESMFALDEFEKSLDLSMRRR